MYCVFVQLFNLSNKWFLHYNIFFPLQVPFLNDCGYFAQQNSPTEQHFPNLQSPTNNFQNGSGLYSPATCSSNIQVLNPVQNSLPSMNSRSRMNNYSQSRMGMVSFSNVSSTYYVNSLKGLYCNILIWDLVLNIGHFVLEPEL